MTLAEFPSLAATKYGKNLPTIFNNIARFEEDRFLIKAQFEAIKMYVNYAIEAAFNSLFEQREYRRADGKFLGTFFANVALTEKEDEMDGAYSYSCATIAGKAKRLEKLPASPFRDAVLALIVEIKPLTDAVTGLKAFIGKKAPKTDPVLAYKAPEASQVAAKAVYDALETVVEANYQSLVAYFAQKNLELVEAFKAAQPISIYEYTVVRDEHERDIGFKASRDILLRVYEEVPGLLHKVDPTISAKAAEIVQKTAEDAATYQKQAFLYKNMSKMDSILEARDDFERVHVINQSLNLLEASIGVFFKNGDKFVARTQIVNVWDVATPFARYPLTFHGISLAGKSHAMFSEEQMNTLFVKA